MPDAATSRVVRTQIVVDCADPHRLAAFWADALRYEHEEIDGFVGGLLDAGHVPAEVTTRSRRQAPLEGPRVDPPPRRRRRRAGAGTGRRLLFQAVPEPKSVKNRVHLDLLVGPE